MKLDYMHPRDQLVAIMNRIYHNGMTTLSGGNLSILEENGDMWITPAGVDKGKLRPQDIVLMCADGEMRGAGKRVIFWCAIWYIELRRVTFEVHVYVS